MSLSLFGLALVVGLGVFLVGVLLGYCIAPQSASDSGAK